MSTRAEWESENLKKFNNLDFKEDIIPVIRKCYELAMQDEKQENDYTDMVLQNINLITNKEPMSITYKQWKSFNAYINSFNPVKSIDTSKLY
jgi:hypothetical protein